jgi:hypothetical protein
LYQLAFPPAVYEGSFFLESSPTFVVGSVLNDSYFNRVRRNLSVGGRGEVAQTMYTHVSKYKNDKINREKRETCKK